MNRLSVFLMTMLVSMASTAGADVNQSTIDDQTKVELTVYNNNLGLVKDVRNISLSNGVGELRFMDVAAYIKPETVHVKSLNHPGDLMILEQNYEYDLMDPNKLLEKFVGKDVRLVDYNREMDTTRTVEARLLSNNNQQPIYKINDEIYLGHPGIVVLPEVPQNLIAKPTLTWLYQQAGEDKHEVEVSYLTDNVSWKADYVLVLDQLDKLGSLSGWVTLNNQSGTDYQNAKLKLVAGEVNRVANSNVRRMSKMSDEISYGMVREQQFEEQGFFEYHIYDLQRQTSIKNNQQKQISLLEADGIKIKKKMVTKGQSYYSYQQYTNRDIKQPIEVRINFKNEKENQLGMPLPKGIVRLYKEDDKKSLQFVGEDNIEHTPKDEEVSLKVGEAFDLVAERTQTDYKRLTTQLYETEWEIKLKNHKEEDVVISVEEPMFGNWKIVSSSQEYKKLDAWTIGFEVSVPKNGEVTVTYRVKVGLE